MGKSSPHGRDYHTKFVLRSHCKEEVGVITIREDIQREREREREREERTGIKVIRSEESVKIIEIEANCILHITSLPTSTVVQSPKQCSLRFARVVIDSLIPFHWLPLPHILHRERV